MSGLGGFDGGRSGPGRPAHVADPWHHEHHAAAQPVPPGLLARPRRRGGVLFTVVVTLALVVGGGVMALVLLASNAPHTLAVGVVLAALPVGPVIACFLWLDRYEPEPARLLLTAFLWGALVATAVALVLQGLDQYLLRTPNTWSAAIVAPVTEEAAKGLFILLLLWFRRRVIDGVLDGIVYAGLVGVGFAFTENILYLGSAYVGGHGQGPGGLGAATTLFIVRGVFSPFAHPLFTSFTGLGVGFAVVARRPGWRVAAPIIGYVAAVIAHASWNASAYVAGSRGFVLTYVFAMVPAFLLLVGFAAWARKREGRMLTRSLDDCARRGYLHPAEVPWLVRLPARRACRRWARQHGGPVAERAMREYQQQAVELAFLHDRWLRGSAPADVAERGSTMVGRLRTLRPYVEFPRAVGTAAASGAPQWQGPR